MIPTSFAEFNAVLGRPADMGDEDCSCLAVLRTRTYGGLPAVVSCWKLTAEELAEINRTGRVWLTVVGKTMSPVSVDGLRPFVME